VLGFRPGPPATHCAVQKRGLLQGTALIVSLDVSSEKSMPRPVNIHVLNRTLLLNGLHIFRASSEIERRCVLEKRAAVRPRFLLCHL
jgi:hypothetical protein